MAVSQLLIKIAADTGNLKTGVDAATKQLDRIQASAVGVGDKLAALLPAQFATGAKNLATSIGGMASSFGSLQRVMGGLAVGAVVHDFLSTTSALTDLSAQTDISIRDLQRFQYAGDLVGVSLDQITGAVGQLQNRLGSMDKSALGGLTQLGLTIAEIQNLQPAQQFEAIASRLSQIQDPAKRAAIAMDLFGRSGISLLPLLRTDLKKVGDEAARMGAVLSESTVKAGDDFDDMITRITAGAKGFAGNAVLGPIIAGFNEIILGIKSLGTSVTDTFDILGLSTAAAMDDFRALGASVDALRGKMDALPAVPGAPKTSGATPSLPAMGDWKNISANLDAQVKAQIKATEATIAYQAAVTSLRETLSGAALQAEVKKLQDAFAGLTKEQQKSPAVMDRVGEAARKLQDEGARLGPTLFTIAQRTEDLSAANFENEQALRSQFGALRDYVIETRQAVTLLPAFVDHVDTLTGSFSRLQDALQDAAAHGGAFVTSQEQIRDVLAQAEEKLLAQERAIRGIVQALGVLANESSGALGNLLSEIANIADAWQNASDAQERYSASGKSLADKALLVAEGAGAIAQATKSKNRNVSVSGGAIAGAQAGLAFGPWGAAVGGAAGAIVGFIRTANQGRKAIEAFADAEFGGFDALRTALNELGDEGERLWKNLTQGVGNGNPAQAQAAIEAITGALDAQKQKQKDVADAAEDTAARIQAAQEAAFAPLKARIEELGQEYDRLFKSIENEAPEEVMGVIEQQTRERMAVIAMEREATTAELKRATDEAASGFTELVRTADDAAREIERIFREIVIPPIQPTIDVRGLPSGSALNLPGAAADVSSFASGSARTPEPVTQTINTYLDGRVIARSTVQYMPDVLEIQGVR